VRKEGREEERVMTCWMCLQRVGWRMRRMRRLGMRAMGMRAIRMSLWVGRVWVRWREAVVSLILMIRQESMAVVLAVAAVAVAVAVAAVAMAAAVAI
jgi:hypothetical protein